MKRWQLLLLAVVLFVFLGPIIYIKGNEALYAARVETYLLEQQHYEETHIASIEGYYGGKLPTFYVTVVFADEQDVTYIYYAHNEVVQAEVERDGKPLDVLQQKELKHTQ